MAQNNNLKHILEINIAMLFISTSGVLGRYIKLSPELTIALRVILATVFLGIYVFWKKESIKVAKKDRGAIALGGILLGAHWVLYFYALQLSNVAIGMLSIFTYPVITSLLEPLILKTKFHKIHLFLAFLVLLGLYFLAPEFSMESDYTVAIICGVLSAVCYALRNIIMKTKVTSYSGAVLMWYQIIIISICLLPVVFWSDYDAVPAQLPAVALLTLFTTVGHTIFLASFKHFSVTTASLMSSVQPVYGIILGVIFLSEFPDWGTVVGGTLILVSVVIESKRSL